MSFFWRGINQYFRIQAAQRSISCNFSECQPIRIDCPGWVSITRQSKQLNRNKPASRVTAGA